MGPSILYFVLIVLCLAVLVYWIVKSHVTRNQKIIMSVISLFAVFGFSVALLAVYSAIDYQGFKPKLGHYIINKFSEDYDIIGRLTLSDKDGEYGIFPTNRGNEKYMGIYDHGNIVTAWMKIDQDGNFYLEKIGEPMSVNLRYVFFPQKELSL